MGKPQCKKKYYYMKSYSPYDNVDTTSLSNMYIFTGYDSQAVLGATKPPGWQELKTDNTFYFSITNMDARGASEGLKLCGNIWLAAKSQKCHAVPVSASSSVPVCGGKSMA
jgi:protease II